MSDPEFKAAVGLSRKWDAREAGREVAVDTLNKLGKGVKPDFFLLFSTIHYEKHGGFQEFLNGVWDVLPEGTLLIGGTVAGFINPQGCYTRGATALAVNYPSMDVVIGVGHNTKRDPVKAAGECVEKIKKSLDKSRYKIGYIFTLISGGLVPQYPGFGRKRILKGLTSELATKLSDVSLKILQMGVGREEEVLKEFVRRLSDYNILSGSSMDNGWAMSNFQFINTEVMTNGVVALAIKTDLNVDLGSVYNLKERATFTVTKLSKNKRIIHEINGKPAVQEFLKLLKWPDNYLDERLYRRTFFYPLGFKQDYGWVGEIVGLILGSSLVVLHEIKNTEMAILSASGRALLEAVDGSLKPFENKRLSLGLISSCDGRLEGLGSHIFYVHEKLLNFFGDVPFLLVYCGGEGMYKPNESLKYSNLTFNTSAFW